ncbi:hypothetical protein H2203_002480 [Taxawa tesnikishii (nom. ined.)]|nr:hypothetical protein H2203_002480 [Dothideales sp. JES 119]
MTGNLSRFLSKREKRPSKAYDGEIKPYNPDTKLLGAENREAVTCYLDALLFAMFARLDSFEAMLYENFEDAPRKKLARLLRLWVNMLRSGKLITVDIVCYLIACWLPFTNIPLQKTQHLQEALAECGWESAAQVRQQDTSEAFTFITGQLELPLLTLKMDLFHTGKEDPKDDHKFVNERLLEVAILEQPPKEAPIEVKRHLEHQRRNTLQSEKSADKVPISEKAQAMHIETVEVVERSESPIQEEPPKNPAIEKLRPTAGRKRADSIFSQRRVVPSDPEKRAVDDGEAEGAESSRQRKGSIRTEVLMPAWQFFKLLPWHTNNAPTSDAQVAAHFSRKRPVLGICLKRYSMSNTGTASRLDTFIDIPLEIAVPNFVTDDNIQENSPLAGNFKLVLQSVVCHRGRSVTSGHYVALVRVTDTSSEEEPDPWMLFDDLARERVKYVDVMQALHKESPYLLFYQVQPIDESLMPVDPPSYNEATSRSVSDVLDERRQSLEPLQKAESTGSIAVDDDVADTVLVDPASPTSPNGAPNSGIAAASDAFDFASSTRTSLDVSTILDGPRGRSSMSSNRRSSLTFDDSSIRSSVPTTPMDESRTSSLGIPVSRRGSKAGIPGFGTIKKSKSRPDSVGAEGSNRFSMAGLNMGGLSMSKLTSRGSKSEPSTNTVDMQISVPEENVTESVGKASESEAAGLKVKEGKEKDKDKGKREKSKSRSRDFGGHHHHHGKKKKGEVPDRDCIVM